MEYADKSYASGQYLVTIELCKKIVGLDEKKFDYWYLLGQCYLKSLQIGKAKQTFLYLSQFIEAKVYQRLGLYYYANSLKSSQDFSKADSVYKALIDLPNVEPYLVTLATRQKEGCQLALKKLGEKRGFLLKNLREVNSSFQEFGAVLDPHSKDLILATTNNQPGLQYDGSQFNGVLPDLTSYRFRNRKWRNQNQSKLLEINSRWAEGSGSFTGDGLQFYFSSCQNTLCRIYVTYKTDGDWSKPKVLNDYVN
ncbi:MAG: hypothetical protein AAFN93_28850, partial [Bacteroidota bacterium]